MPKFVGGGRSFPPGICVQSDPPPFQTAQFRPISAHSASTVIASDKSSISTYRKSTTRFPTSHRWTVYVTPKSPKGWHKNAISLFVPVKFNLSRKKSATKFLCEKTSSGKVVATRGVRVYPYPRVYPTRPVPAGMGRIRVDVLRVGSGTGTKSTGKTPFHDVEAISNVFISSF